MSSVDKDVLYEIAGILQKGLESSETYDLVFNILEKSVLFNFATLFLFNQKLKKLEVVHQEGNIRVDLVEEFSFDHGKGMSSWVSKQSRPIIIQSLKKYRAGKDNLYHSLVSMPLRIGEKLIGVLNLAHKKPNIYAHEDIDDYFAVASQISAVLEKMLLRKEYEEKNKQLKNTLKTLEETQGKLIEKERMAAIGEIVVVVNHEINNPLSNIIGLADILELSFNTGKSDRILEGLKSIKKGAYKIQKITERLSMISSSESEDYVGSIKMTKLPNIEN